VWARSGRIEFGPVRMIGDGWTRARGLPSSWVRPMAGEAGVAGVALVGRGSTNALGRALVVRWPCLLVACPRGMMRHHGNGCHTLVPKKVNQSFHTCAQDVQSIYVQRLAFL
jgi:hypothetical protein